MTITLDLPPDLEAKLLAEAAEKGKPIVEVLKERLYQSWPAPDSSWNSPEGFNTWLANVTALIPAATPSLSDAAMSRESIYSREDDWNR